MRPFASLAALLLSMALAVPSAEAQTQGATRDQVRQLLSGFETTPSDDDWRRLGDGALPHLIALYDDPREPAYVRLRAVGAAGAFPQPAVRTFLLAVTHAPDQSDLLVREAVRALGRAFGADARTELEAFLAHEAPLVREVAVVALGRLEHTADALLRARLTIESDSQVRGAIQRALQPTR